ncbi:MAG: DNA repair protein RecN [Chromatiales bacterium]|jgi:DNA repair protein RecN (Recombination protein N)
MLCSISIKNLAIVTQLQLDFSTGMSALTGETGAGKSILIDALGLALGDKADKGMIRADSDKAEITAVFDISDIREARDWLVAQELDDGHECFLRRVITRDNRSKAYINGSPAPLKSLQELGSLLIEIHGQHAHQRLLKRSFQLAALDQFANHAEMLQQTAAAYDNWHKAASALQHLQQQDQDRASRLDLLKFQAEELSQLNLQAGETAQLEADFKTLSNADRLQQGCYELCDLLYENDQALHGQLGSAQSRLGQLVELNDSLGDNLELLESALINIQECNDSLKHFADKLDSDGQNLAEIEQRLQLIYELSRKYRLEPEQLVEKTSAIADELAELENADQRLEQLAQQAATLKQQYFDQARQLSAARHKAAAKLKANTKKLLKSLAMPNVEFDIRLSAKSEDKANDKGIDDIEFLVTTNPGQPPAPIAKIASGGELSRISLAIQVATMSNMNVPTLIFDEVDVGIGGATAEVVGRLLRKLGANQQVLCVTHLPQVAAQAHQQMKVEKQQRKNTTSTSITPLESEQRISEIARMLGGIEVTEQTLAHAEEMISKAGV